MLTGKQEKFAREVAKGSTQTDAYKTAYDTKNMADATIWTEASLLTGNPNVTKRIEELREASLQHVKYDIEAHYKELEELRELALTPTGDKGYIDVKAAAKVVELKGKVKGLYTTKVENTIKGSSMKEILDELEKNDNKKNNT